MTSRSGQLPPDAPHGNGQPSPDGWWVRGAKARMPTKVKEGAKVPFRAYGVMTSPLRQLPTYLVIGAKRCGTTSLQRYLLAHPQVAPLFPRTAHVKGAHYFDRNAYRPLSWYRSFFPARLSGKTSVCGDVSPYYFIHPHAAERAAATVPGAKIIALLRDPVERAVSQYRDEVKCGHETLSLADALAAEATRLDADLTQRSADPRWYGFVHEHLCYRTWGRYAEHLSRWSGYFPRDQILLLRSVDLFERPHATYQAVTDFLGLAPYLPPTFARYNATWGGSGDVGVVGDLREYYRRHDEELRRAWPMPHGWSWSSGGK